MQDLHTQLFAAIVGNATLSADNAPAAIDLQGYSAAEILLLIGIGGITFTGTNKVEFVLTHSDDDSTYTAVTTADMIGCTVASGGIIKSLVAAHAAPAAYRFGYKGGKRYLKLLADFSGTHGTGTPIGMCVLLGEPNIGPVANQA
ncbi:MAG: hypothetical protein K2P68_10200 [Sphingomonas sp.]|nr:hypothetical protein [Sphingomonas sp.]